MPQLSRDSSRGRRRSALTGVPWLPQPTPGGPFLGYTLSGLAASKFGIMAIITAMIAATGVVGSEMGKYLQRQEYLRSHARLSPGFGGRANLEKTASLSADDGQTQGSLALFAAANRAVPDGAPGAEGTGAQAGQDASAKGAAGAGASKADGDKGADASAGDAVKAALAQAQAAAQGGGAAGAAGGGAAAGNGRQLLAALPSMFGQSSGNSAGAFGGGSAGAAGAGANGGKLEAFSRPFNSSVGPAQTMRSAAAAGGPGKDFNRLAAMNGIMKPTVGMKGAEGPAYRQTSAWDSPTPAATAGGAAVQGAGDASGSPGATLAGPSGNSGMALPTAIPASALPQPAPVAPSNVTPWQKYVNLAVVLMAVASILLVFAGILGMIHTPATFMIGKILAGMALAMSVAVMGIGAMTIMNYGQSIQGWIFIVMGSVLAGLSAVTMMAFKSSSVSGKGIAATLKKAAMPVASRIPGVAAVGGGMTGLSQAGNMMQDGTVQAPDPNAQSQGGNGNLDGLWNHFMGPGA